MAGKWVESLLQQISQGLDSLDQNADYSFIPDDRRYKVEANRQNGEVNVTIARGDFFTDRTPVIGHFGRAQLQQIGTLIADAPARENRFREHETLFFSRANE